MNILFPVAECVPFAKTGGLADIAGSLPKALQPLGHRVHVIMPFYRGVAEMKLAPKLGARISVALGKEQRPAEILDWAAAPSGPQVHFIRCDDFFNRDHLYGDAQGDYADNDERFIFFCRAVMEWARTQKEAWDIIHSHDWHTGLIPVYLKLLYRNEPALANTRTLFTVHNLGYQGHFPPDSFSATGLPEACFHPAGVEFRGGLNFMKSALVYADWVNTVSQTYAQEIQRPEYSFGLDGVLRARKDTLSGIINGLDTDIWDPIRDGFLPVNFQNGRLDQKEEIKTLLLNELGLNPLSPDPLLAVISRLDDQKGLDILAEAMPRMMQSNLQMVILGAGIKIYHDLLLKMKARFPGKLAVRLGFDNPLAHRIYAGADMFLMPSLYEPCGLGQLISMRYATVPIVRRTGGLKDTVHDVNGPNANGFVFNDYSSSALLETVRRALAFYQDRTRWRALAQSVMKLDFSWAQSAKEYHELYSKITPLAPPQTPKPGKSPRRK